MDAMEFFQNSAGRWKSSRVTHHLAFKRSEPGESEIVVETLTADDPEIIELCQMHEVDPSLSVGGSRVRWLGTMAWDKEGEENHEGQTVFAIVPDVDNPRQGRLLRERGYAEIMPVIGRFHLDEEEGLVLTTDYETMSSTERFWFSGSNMRMRTSTVKRFGGFSTASYCVESRIDADAESVFTENESVAPQLTSVLGW
ncbi:phycobiliprotein lyase [Brunnivagina elsteri]|uniref:Chromophore lyase CpcS/CpeS n=1 Tax=Brunnivagina elsteri CCALA 953 TaxID=987040 RepID=A0A2A2TJU8_9CYAN|nr:phycobiliprotein lyase [Calothrix elsteri]PAX55882.1 phycobiliprotein lyase [Calothrix elsteri CCALA 953]